MAIKPHKEELIDTEITNFRYNKAWHIWTATFTEKELRNFVKRIRKRAKDKLRKKQCY